MILLMEKKRATMVIDISMQISCIISKIKDQNGQFSDKLHDEGIFST
jgi:hypothetical protein